LASKFEFPDKNEARSWFNRLRQKFLDYNGCEWKSERFQSLESEIAGALSEQSKGIEKIAEKFLV
jgi:V/A-type H+-transporting ATPase subunit A